MGRVRLLSLNSWEGGDGNLFFSLAISIDDLPDDLPLTSASIYFSYIMKEVLSEYIEDMWVKWPNDLYYNQHKIGGTITKKMDNIFLCGMGINLQKNSNSFKALNLNVEPISLLKNLSQVQKFQLLKLFSLRFCKLQKFQIAIQNFIL